MSIVLHPIRSFRSLSSVALAALALAAAPCLPTAQAVTIQVAHDIGLEHTKAQPYNFVGRVFDLDNIGFGTGTLLRRHTVLTAGHVVYEPATGFLANSSFTRALYEDYRLSVDQIISASALSGYTSDVINEGTNADLVAFRNDQGLVLLNDPPVDENWADYATTPTLLAGTPGHLFVLGYPGSSGFDGLKLAFIVPQTPFVGVGNSLNTGSYENDTYQAIGGMSGGPTFYSTTTGAFVPGSTQFFVLATTVGGADDNTGEFNQSFVRAITKQSGKFIADAEYTAGLISKVKISGPKTVSRGQTYTYTTKIQFAVPTDTGAAATTDRYSELKVRSSTPGTSAAPFVIVKKLSNTTFSVTFTNNIRSGTTTTLQAFYDKTATPQGNSSLTIKIQ